MYGWMLQWFQNTARRADDDDLMVQQAASTQGGAAVAHESRSVHPHGGTIRGSMV